MQLLIKGGNSPHGYVDIGAAKNAVLPIIAACTMSSHTIVLHNISPFGDVLEMLSILRHLGCIADIHGDTITINCKSLNSYRVNEIDARKLRASICLLGPLSTRSDIVDVALPGGCNIGSRPIDIHIDGFKKLGFTVEQNESVILKSNGFYSTNSNCPLTSHDHSSNPTTIKLDMPSVGATQNLVMAACGIDSTTTILNAAQEPEVVDLINFINAIGGKISGAGTSTIVIEGKLKSISDIEYTPIGDRVVAGTYLLTAALGLGGDVTTKGVDPMHMQHFLKIMQEMGAEVSTGTDYVRLKSKGRLKSFSTIKTRPYPGFATDMQAQLVTALTLANGKSTVYENLFENRFGHVPQLASMGADINIIQNTLQINGVDRLHPSNLHATDLRCGASMVLAALSSKGTSTVDGVDYINRGYYKIWDDLNQLGLDVRLI